MDGEFNLACSCSFLSLEEDLARDINSSKNEERNTGSLTRWTFVRLGEYVTWHLQLITQLSARTGHNWVAMLSKALHYIWKESFPRQGPALHFITELTDAKHYILSQSSPMLNTTFYHRALRCLILHFIKELSNAEYYILSKSSPMPNTTFFHSALRCSHSGELWMQKLKPHLLRTQSSKVLPSKRGVGQYLAIHATLTARDFFLAYFYPSGPFACIFSKTSLLCWLRLTPVSV